VVSLLKLCHPEIKHGWLVKKRGGGGREVEAHQTSQVFVLRDSSKQNANACSSFFSPSTWFVVILLGEEGRMLNDTLGVVCAVPNEGNQFVFICWFHGKKEMIMFLVGLEQEGGCKEGGDGRNTMKSQFTNQWNQQNNKVKCSPIIIA
jgi:hypothetical protein